MVPGEGTATATGNAYTLLTNTPLPTNRLFPIKDWRVRSGRNSDYVKWENGILQLASALGLTLDQLLEKPPSPMRSSVKTPNTPSYEPFDAHASPWDAVPLVQWQAVNTSIYYHVKPTLVLEGLYEDEDLEEVLALAAPLHALADGRGLIAWARKFADVSGMKEQGDLVRVVQDAKVKASVTRAQLMVFIKMLLGQWCLIEGNTKMKPYPFYMQLLIALPTEPQATHIVSARSWFAQRVNDYQMGVQNGFSDPRHAIKQLLDHAKDIGLPEGDMDAAQRASVNLVLAPTPGVDPFENVLMSLGAYGGPKPSGGGPKPSDRTNGPRTDLESRQ